MRAERAGWAAVVRGLIVSLAIGLAACGGDDDGTDGDRDAGGDDASSDDGGDDGCDEAEDCPDGQVCDPATDECAELTCTDHGDCGTGGYCADGGECDGNETGGPCDEDVNCPDSHTCTGGFCGCEGQLFQADSVPPNILILLDRSSSMNQPVMGGGMETKWDEANAAVTTLLAEHGDQIRFGFMLYPGVQQVCEGGTVCVVGAPTVDVGADTAADINAYLGGATTCNLMTPTTEALAALPDYAGLEDTERPNFVLLITDGESNCDEDPGASAAVLRMQDPEIRTFVIGFGGGVDADELNDLAMEGGTARQAAPFYYVADAPGELDSAFAEIAGSVLSCTYDLEEEPDDLDDLYIYFDGEPVLRDTAQMNGWDYDEAANRLTFYGAACAALQGGVGDLAIVYGCPTVVD